MQGYPQASGYPQQQPQDYNYAQYYQGQYAQQQQIGTPAI
jgi:splicing factor 1